MTVKEYLNQAYRLEQRIRLLKDNIEETRALSGSIDVDTFTEAMLERQRRMKALGRTDHIKPAIQKTALTNFHFGEVAAYYDDPVSQAEYLYSLIESEER